MAADGFVQKMPQQSKIPAVPTTFAVRDALGKNRMTFVHKLLLKTRVVYSRALWVKT
jgi:hypothetical protein